jgi:hypothetical protein
VPLFSDYAAADSLHEQISRGRQSTRLLQAEDSRLPIVIRPPIRWEPETVTGDFCGDSGKRRLNSRLARFDAVPP